MNKYFTLSALSWLLPLLLFAAPTFAQQQSFIAPVNEIPDSREMQEYQSRLRRNDNLASYQFIRLNPLATSQKDGMLVLNIPGHANPITAEASHVEYHDEENYEWIGKTDDGRGTVIILAKSGQICAHISAPEGVFEIFPAPGGLHSLQEVDALKAGDVGCVDSWGEAGSKNGRTESESTIVQTALPPGPAKDNENAKMNPCQPKVNPRVLVLYTPKALNIAGSLIELTSRVDLSISQFNSCIYNSDITSQAVLELAGIVAFNEPLPGNTITNDLNTLEVNQVAQNLRNQYNADLVVLLAGIGYDFGNTKGKAQTVKLENSRSYAVVDVWAASAMKTFAHEVGHLYGCRHENDNTELPTYAKAYLIKVLGVTVNRTMMATADNDNQAAGRLLNFSNPNIQVSGKATGTNDANNAKRITESNGIISAFRPNPAPPLAAYINGPTWVSTQGIKTYELDYSCGSAPYSFVWQYSYDGVNYTTSNITTDVFTWPFYQNQKIYLKGTVSANGKSVTAFIAITAQMPSPYKQAALDDSSAIENPISVIAPNPANNTVTISYTISEEALVQIEVLDKQGRTIRKLTPPKEKQRPGEYNMELPTGTMRPDIYFVRITSGSKTVVKRLIISK